MNLTTAETATVLAALRHYQDCGYTDPAQHCFLSEHIIRIATDGDTVKPLDSAGIDALCERINFSGEHPILTHFKEALDNLLTETVDMDLEHGIELTEGEEAARNQALACFLIHPLGQAEPKEPTPEEVAETILAEIRQDEQLAACRTFSELHDHCDANMLGCSALLLEAFGMDRATAILNAAQEIVNASLPITKTA